MELLPTIESEHLMGGVIYHDGQFDDARLAINLAQTAVEQGAVMINHMACTGLIKENGRVVGIQLHDKEGGLDCEVRARCLINATGVFADGLRHLDDPGSAALLRPSQGVHLVLPRRFLPGDSAIMVPKTDDGRVLFAVPWHGCLLLGTTDTPVDRVELEPRAKAEEIEFLLTHASRFLTAHPTPSDVLSVFAGLRPLVNAAKGDTASLSRDHHIDVAASGLVTITGGKWTTYRRMAEDVVDQAELVAGLEPRHCLTEAMLIHGADGVGDPTAALAVYGSDAPLIEALQRPERLHPRLTLTAGEVVWHVRHEMARTVEDVMARRSRCLLLDARASADAAPSVARVMAEELGRDETWEQAQVAGFRALAQGYVL